MEKLNVHEGVCCVLPENIKTKRIKLRAKNVRLEITKSMSDRKYVSLVLRGFLRVVPITQEIIMERQHVIFVYVAHPKQNKANPIATIVPLGSIKMRKAVLNAMSAIIIIFARTTLLGITYVVSVLKSLTHVLICVQTIHTTAWVRNANGVRLDIFQRVQTVPTLRYRNVLHNTNVQNVLRDVMKIQRQKMSAQKQNVKCVQMAHTRPRLVQPLSIHVNYVPLGNMEIPKVSSRERIVKHAHLGDMEIEKVSSNVNFVPPAKL